MFFKKHRQPVIRTVKVLLFTLGLYIGLVVLGTCLIMVLPRVAVTDTPSSVGLAYENISFPSRDTEVTLAGWFLPAAGENVIIFVHGGYQPRIDTEYNTLAIVRDLTQRGYNVLLFAPRGRGESTGKARSLTGVDRDIGGAVDYLKTRGFAAADIGIVGVCSGSASVTLFASQEAVGALALDGCFPRTYDMLVRLALDKGIPRWLLNVFYKNMKYTAGIIFDFEIWDPIDNIPQITSPILFIHEEQDIMVSSAQTRELWQAAVHPESELWEIPDVPHSRAYNRHPAEYVQRLDDFFRKTLD